MSLQPTAEITAPALATGQRALVADAAWASMTGALSGGVVMVAFALELGAGPRAIGLLGAILFMAQAALSSTASCAINGWFQQLLPPASLGVFFSKRLLWATGVACVCTLGAGLLVDHPPLGQRRLAFAACFAAAGLAGLVSSWCLYRCPEPVMDRGGPPRRLREQLVAPFAERGFRGLLVMLAGWNLASNLVAPFLTVYLMRQLGYGLGTVTALWVASQVANSATLLSWGRVSDRLSNQSILSVAVPLYFAGTLGLIFVPDALSPTLRLAFLFGLHALMGVAGGGIGLATGNLGMKLAPRDRATAYLAAIGLVGAATGGAAPLVGGALAQWFSERQLSLLVRWVSPTNMREVSVLHFAHWEFLFAISALLGLYVLHAVSKIREGAEISERRVIQEMGLEALRTVNQVSSFGGVLGSTYPFGRLSERRRAPRRGPAAR